MKNHLKHSKLIIFLIFTILTIGCKKQNDWLGAKSSKADVTPETIADYQAILDNDNFINNRFTTIGLLASDNLYLDNTGFSSARDIIRSAYIWSPARDA